MAEAIRGNLPTILQSKKRKRLIISLICVALFLAGSYYVYRIMTTTTTNTFMQLATVKRGDVTESVTSSGTVQASKRISLSPSDETATLTAINVKVGDHVKAGQVLATLDDTNSKVKVKAAEANLLSAKAKLDDAKKTKTAAEMAALQANVTKAQAALDSAKSGFDIKKAQNDVTKSKANLQDAQNNFDTQKKLYDAGIISKSEYDQAVKSLDQAKIDYDNTMLQSTQTQAQAKSSLQEAQANYETAVQELNDAKQGPEVSAIQTAQAAVEQAEANLQEEKTTLKSLSIVAPMDGVIVQVNGNMGEAPSKPFIIMDNSNSGSMEVLAQISESDIGKVKEGLDATFTSSTYEDKTFTGKVSLVYPEASTESNVTTYKVLLTVDNKEGLLKTGMTTNVTIVVGTHKDVLYVPAAALKTQGGKDGVYLSTTSTGTTASGNTGSTTGTQQENGKSRSSRIGNFPYRFKEVKIGYYSSNMVEITSGLEEGQQVVLTMENTSGSSGSSSRQNQGGMPGMGGFGGGGFGGGGFSGGGNFGGGGSSRGRN
ncbi:efflux RND transporter periplasmic adaptor subunit [Brevibacillus fluminis]|uniref:efflux RND transporter periplasmic adaptor subunit n=1 Tax=Brevibacillus fluminis TaxID=511487 RepID=UPI003F89EA96